LLCSWVRKFRRALWITLYMQPLVSSLSAGDCPVHRLRKKRADGRVYWLDVTLVVTWEINQGYTTMHGQPVIKNISCSVYSVRAVGKYRQDG
jgi:hypothetical protein